MKITTDGITTLLLTAACLLGACAIGWMGYDFAGTNTLALTVTAVIGAVYLLGIVELLGFRRATASLGRALDSLTEQTTATPGWLEPWFERLAPSLRPGVRLRIAGERSGLPSPAFTPYLVGLLVMLGLLGTFVGMVDTLGGAVSALQGSTELDAIRASLTAPIQGLGVAFGTSIAGVAASAMLGLISTLVRHERLRATRRLDASIATVFREFTLDYQRQAAFDALQTQAGALPAVASDLQAVAAQLARMGEQLGEALLANQTQFHTATETHYRELATSIDQSLRESLAASGQAAGASMRPVMTEALTEISGMLQETQRQQALSAHDQLQALGTEFSTASNAMLAAFATTSTDWMAQTQALQNDIKQTLTTSVGELVETTGSSTTTLLDAFTTTSTDWMAQTQALQNEIKQTLTASVDELADTAGNSTTTLLDTFTATSTDWMAQTQALQNEIKQTLTAAVSELTATARSSTTTLLAEIGGLLQSTEALVQARSASEAGWLESQGERMTQLTAAIAEQLAALRAQEEQGQAVALARLGDLEATVATHLTQLGAGLEAPMTRLIETASETPRAAAEVIGALRVEIGNNIERDNQLLQERLRIMQELNTLSASLQDAATEQRSAVENLVTSSAAMLQDTTQRFGEHLQAGVEKMSEASAHVAGGAIELSSLGEAFTLAVDLFNSSNEAMMAHLTRVEEAMERSGTRSDEQMAYYVAQAREIIDHSMLSQKEIIDDMQRLKRQSRQLAAGAQ